MHQGPGLGLSAPGPGLANESLFEDSYVTTTHMDNNDYHAFDHHNHHDHHEYNDNDNDNDNESQQSQTTSVDGMTMTSGNSTATVVAGDDPYDMYVSTLSMMVVDSLSEEMF